MADNDKLVRFESEIRPLAGGDILHAPAESLTVPEVVEAYAVVKFLEDRVKNRREALRQRILNDKQISDAAKVSKSGGGTTRVGGHKVTRKKSTTHFGAVDKIRQVLKEKGLSEDDVFDDKIETKVTKVVNPSKMEKLLERGKLTAEEIESFHKVVWSVVVDPSEDLEQLLEAADKRLAASQLLAANPDDDGEDF